ncbi:MAG TPA: DUF4062 domain-containing protein [Terriglobales bacterium]|jgi:hypothetical protein|nr:DUF4062 domain-containing protein [Terriglobales bacterium]
MEPIEVFVSSTYRDKEWREAAIEAIRNLPGFRPLLVEAATAPSVAQHVLEQIVKADVVVLLVGRQYGTMVPGRNESFVEMEYEVAAKSGKPIIALIQAKLSRKKPDLEEQKNLNRLMAFRERLEMNHLVHTFRSADDLRQQLTLSLLKIEKKRLGPTFSIAFDPELSEDQVRTTFHALSEYFRACGGVGLAVEFERQEVQVGDILHV